MPASTSTTPAYPPVSWLFGSWRLVRLPKRLQAAGRVPFKDSPFSSSWLKALSPAHDSGRGPCSNHISAEVQLWRSTQLLNDLLSEKQSFMNKLPSLLA
jgi:hypothetical protein